MGTKNGSANGALRQRDEVRVAIVGGALTAPSSYLMKSPPKQVPDPVAHDDTEAFIAEHAVKKTKSDGKAAAKAKTEATKAAAK